MDTTSFKVEDLTEGDEYEFRVQAYNVAGPSRPSTTAGPILIQDQTCKHIHFFRITHINIHFPFHSVKLNALRQ